MSRKRKLSDRPEPYQSENWAWSMLNYQETEMEYIKSLSEAVPKPYIYLQFQQEICPKTGTPHLQGMVCFEKKPVRSTVQKTLSPARPTQLSCKPMYADVRDNVIYTSKEETRKPGTVFWSDGDLGLTKDPEKLDANGRAEVLLSKAEAGDFVGLRREHQASFLYNHNVLRNAYARTREFQTLDGVLDNYWICGPGGVGKDQTVQDIAGEKPYVKNGGNKWWTEYDYQETVVIRDVGKSVLAFIDDLKNWLDRYPCSVEWKGGGGLVRPKRIIITSNYHPAKLLGDDSEHLLPILRRVQVVKMSAGHAVRMPRLMTERPPKAVWSDATFDPDLPKHLSARVSAPADDLEDEVVDDGM